MFTRIELDIDSYNVIVYFLIGTVGLLMIPLCLDFMAPFLPVNISRVTNSASNISLMIGIVGVYVCCLCFHFVKVLPHMQREYGTSSTSTVIHTIITWFFVINGLCHFFLAVALQPNSRNERISELWTPYSKTAKPEPYADAHAGSVPNSVVANSIVDKTSGSDRCDNVTLSNTSAISDGAHAQQDRLDDNVSRIEVASGTITAKIKGENSEMDNAAEVKAQELSSKNSNVHESGRRIEGIGQNDKEKRVCKFCAIERNRMQLHCHHCRSCSAYMDHHCPFINGCVWECNYAHFFLFLVYSCVGLWYALWITAPILRDCFLQGHSKSESCAGLGGPLTFMAVPLSALNILVLIILLLEVLVLFVDISTFMWFKGLDRGMIKHTRGAYEYAVRKSRIPGKASRFEVLLKGPLRRNGYIMALIPPLHILARVCSFNVSLYLRPNSRECHDNSKSKSKPHDKNC